MMIMKPKNLMNNLYHLLGLGISDHICEFMILLFKFFNDQKQDLMIHLVLYCLHLLDSDLNHLKCHWIMGIMSLYDFYDSYFHSFNFFHYLNPSYLLDSHNLDRLSNVWFDISIMQFLR